MKKAITKGAFMSILIAILSMGALASCTPSHPFSEQNAHDSEEKESEENIPETSAIEWSDDIECARCHTTEQESLSDQTKGAATHQALAQTNCTVCHANKESLTRVHLETSPDSPAPKNLRDTSVGNETCKSAKCHNDQEFLIESTKNYSGLVDSRGTIVNPHNVIGLTAGHADITCADCHSMHGKTLVAEELCVSCHHSGVYECNTCH